MQKINAGDYEHIVFFTGAGMSAECGVPTYRGRGGVWARSVRRGGSGRTRSAAGSADQIGGRFRCP